MVRQKESHKIISELPPQPCLLLNSRLDEAAKQKNDEQSNKNLSAMRSTELYKTHVYLHKIGEKTTDREGSYNCTNRLTS